MNYFLQITSANSKEIYECNYDTETCRLLKYIKRGKDVTDVFRNDGKWEPISKDGGLYKGMDILTYRVLAPDQLFLELL